MSKKQKTALSKKDKALIKKTLAKAAMSTGGVLVDFKDFTERLMTAFKSVNRD